MNVTDLIHELEGIHDAGFGDAEVLLHVGGDYVALHEVSPEETEFDFTVDLKGPPTWNL